MMKYLLLALLACSVLTAYNATKAKSMAYICASTFGTEAEINSWTCKYCSYNKLTNVKNIALRPKLSIIPSLISLDSLATSPLRTPLSLPSEAQSAFRTGLSISMPPRYLHFYKGSLSRLLRLPSAPRILQRLLRS